MASRIVIKDENFKTDNFHSYLISYQVLPLWLRVELGVIEMKSTPNSPDL